MCRRGVAAGEEEIGVAVECVYEGEKGVGHC